MQSNTGETWSEGRIDRASNADCRISFDLSAMDSDITEVSSHPWARVANEFKTKRRQIHWSRT